MQNNIDKEISFLKKKKKSPELSKKNSPNKIEAIIEDKKEFKK